MMSYGAHVFLWHSRSSDDDLAQLLDRAAGLGLAFLEIPVGDDVCFDAAALGRRAQRNGVDLVLSPGGLWPAEADISLPSAEARRFGIDWHSRALDLCAECGAVAYTGAIYGHPGTLGDAPPSAVERERIAEGLHTLAQAAADRGVELVLEPMSHFRTHVANTPAQAEALMRLADHGNLFVLLDTYHLCTEVTSYRRAIRDALPRLWGLHACENNRGVPGTGILPWDEIVRTLRDGGWSGRVGFESYNSTCDDGAFAFSRGMFHSVCPDGDAFVGQARAFLEKLFTEMAAAEEPGHHAPVKA